MQEILDLLGFDIFTIVWDFIQTIANFIGTLFNTVMSFIGYLYYLNPMVFAVFVLGLVVSCVFGILKLINLLPFL